MQGLELFEGEQRVVRIDLAGRLVHRVEQGAQLRLARRRDWRQDHEI